MYASVNCPKCGYANSPDSNFCSNCAAQLNVRPQPAVTPQPTKSMPPPQWSGSDQGIWYAVQAARRIEIDRTKTGFLLVIVGLLLGPVPYAVYIGLILAIIGVIMVIIGRGPFGTSHSKYVIASVGVYCVGAVIVFVAGFVFSFSLVQVALGGGSQALGQSLINAFDELLVGVLLGGIVIALAYVLFTYALQDSPGRLLLYVAFAAQLVFGVLAAYIVSGQVASAVSQSFATGSYDPSPVTALQSQLQYLQLLGLIPAGLFAVSYYRAYSRISKGEIPQPTRQMGPVTPG